MIEYWPYFVIIISFLFFALSLHILSLKNIIKKDRINYIALVKKYNDLIDENTNLRSYLS